MALPTGTSPAAGVKPERLGALAALLPYLARYRLRALAALAALVSAALVTLAVPLAIRSMIDVGFSGSDAAFVNRSFLALIVLAGLLALASAGALLPRHHARRAHRRRPPARPLRAPDAPVRLPSSTPPAPASSSRG